jgi:hypothetical protein
LLDSYASSSFFTLIKGIVPAPLYNFIHSKLLSHPLTSAACTLFMHFVFEVTHIIWKDRCTIVHEFESNFNIDLQSKIDYYVTSGFSTDTNPSSLSALNHPIASMIRFGSYWSNF